MNYPVYAIRDVHVGFLTPTVDQNDASAMRNFRHAVQQTGSIMNSHAKDFCLYRIGEFNSETGVITSVLPEVIIDGASVL